MKKRIVSRYCLTVLLLIIAVLMIPSYAEAAKKPGKKAVKKLYHQFLQQSMSGSDYFITLDINRDGVKELITSKPRRSSYSDDIYSVYTIRSGKVTLLGTVSESSSYNYKASGKKKAIYYNKKCKAIRDCETGPYSTSLTLYRIAGSKLKQKINCTAIYNRYRIFQVSYGTSGPKSVSESRLKSLEKKYMKKQCKKIRLVLNTEKNRTKKL